MINKETLGGRIAYFRLQLDITQGTFLGEVNRLTGRTIRQSTLSSWEQGHTSPPMELSPAFAHILKIDLNQLFDYEDPLQKQETPSTDTLAEVEGLRAMFCKDQQKTFEELLEAYKESLALLKNAENECLRLKSNNNILKIVTSDYLNRLE